MEKQEPVTKKSSSGSSVAKVIAGLILIILGMIAIISWWPDLWVVIRGCVGLFLLLAGAVTIAIART
jgi:hypothetical protein